MFRTVPLFVLLSLTGCTSDVLDDLYSKEGKFRAKMPKGYKLDVNTVQDNHGIRVNYTYSFMSKNGGGYFADFSDIEGVENDSDKKKHNRLLNLQNFAIAQSKGKLIESKQIVLQEKYPGIEFTSENSKQTVTRRRSYFVGKRLFTLAVLGSEAFINSPTSLDFLDSFQFLDI